MQFGIEVEASIVSDYLPINSTPTKYNESNTYGFLDCNNL